MPPTQSQVADSVGLDPDSWLSIEVDFHGRDARMIRAAADHAGDAYDATVRTLAVAGASGQLAGYRHALVFLIVGLVGLVLGLLAPALGHAWRSTTASLFS